MSDQDEIARSMGNSGHFRREAAVAGEQDECDDSGCACHRDVGERPGDGAAEVTMTEVYDIEFPWGNHPSGW
jgi:hypothetical protein